MRRLLLYSYLKKKKIQYVKYRHDEFLRFIRVGLKANKKPAIICREMRKKYGDASPSQSSLSINGHVVLNLK